MQPTTHADEMTISAQEALQHAYLCLGFGQYPEAIAACEAAEKLAPGHPLPPTLRASFEMAVGRVGDALAILRQVTRRHRENPLAMLYFAEACFLAGRPQAGRRALGRAAELPMSEGLRELLTGLNDLWASIPADVVPPPLVARVEER